MLQLDPWQEEVLNADGNVLLCSGRQVGKSTIIARRASMFATANSNKSILIISATERQAEELFIKVLMNIAPNLLKKGKDRPTKHVIKLKNGSVVRCLPTGLAGVGIRGFTIDLLIADEAAFINEEVWQAVTPMLLTTGGNIILVSTPHGRGGYFWDRYNDPGFKVFHINSEKVITEREISESWTIGQREGALARLESEKKSMSAMRYAQEYMGEFVDSLRQFFNDSLIKRCMTLKRRSELVRGRAYYMGCDIARMGEDEGTFEIIDKLNKTTLEQVENIVTVKKLTTETEDNIINLEAQYGFKKIGIDAGAGTLGVSILDHLLNEPLTKRKITALNNRKRVIDHDGKQTARLLKEDMYSNLLALMERGYIKLLDDDEIFLSLKSVQYEYEKEENKLTSIKIFGTYTHIAEGLIRAAWLITEDKSLNPGIY